MPRRRRRRRFPRLSAATKRRLVRFLWRALRSKWTWIGLLVLILVLTIQRSCGAPPEDLDDLCSIFRQKRSWYHATRRSAEVWGVPEPVQLAIIHQESRFEQTARPPRRRILWIFPGPRRSSAYGYGQVIDGTWDTYVADTNRRNARRDRFVDVADFIGWYGDHVHRKTGVAKNDPRHLYLAYHEGPGGYARGSHQAKPWLLKVAGRVETRAARYSRQYDACREDLDSWLWFLH